MCEKWDARSQGRGHYTLQTTGGDTHINWYWLMTTPHWIQWISLNSMNFLNSHKIMNILPINLLTRLNYSKLDELFEIEWPLEQRLQIKSYSWSNFSVGVLCPCEKLFIPLLFCHFSTRILRSMYWNDPPIMRNWNKDMIVRDDENIMKQ